MLMPPTRMGDMEDRKSTRLNSSHGYISYAVFCLKKKKKPTHITTTQSTTFHDNQDAIIISSPSFFTAFLLVPLRLAFFSFFFFNDPATTEIYTLSLHDALPIFAARFELLVANRAAGTAASRTTATAHADAADTNGRHGRSEEHTSELQSRLHLVCRLLLEKKKKTNTHNHYAIDNIP